MSNIQSRLDSLQPYITGIRYVQGHQIVDGVFKTGWTIPESEIVKKEMVNAENNSYVFYTEKEGFTFDDLLDYVEDIININIEREKKHDLLKLKVKELQEIFKNTSLSKLNSLKFSFNEPDLIDSLDDLGIDMNEPLEEIKVPVVNEKTTTATPKKEEVKVTKEKTNETTVTTIKGQEIELPPKGTKIEVEEFNEPTNIVCKCGPDDICPVCEEEKF
jgi:hypothetical protein